MRRKDFWKWAVKPWRSAAAGGTKGKVEPWRFRAASAGDGGMDLENSRAVIRGGEPTHCGDMSRRTLWAYWISPGQGFVRKKTRKILGNVIICGRKQNAVESTSRIGVYDRRCGERARRCPDDVPTLASARKERGFLAMQFNFVVSSKNARCNCGQSMGFDVVGRRRGV